jgi:hypothetical protein
MLNYFLDYYHPYAGLCNQLYLITNHMHDCYNKGVKLYIHKFNIDIFKKKRINADKVIDFYKTNENIEKLTGKNILLYEKPKIIEYIPKLCIYPVSSIEFLNCLEFHESITEKVKSIKLKSYYGIHFRLDIDAILHYTFENYVYTKFMDLCNSNIFEAIEYFKSLNQEKISKYCNFLMKQYFTFIEQIGFDKPWYICTSILKWKIHDPMIIYLNKLTQFILENGGTYYIPPEVYDERELNALVDLLVLRDSEKMIGFEGSSFSEGYCYKINSIRKITKEFLFVKEYE